MFPAGIGSPGVLFPIGLPVAMIEDEKRYDYYYWSVLACNPYVPGGAVLSNLREKVYRRNLGSDMTHGIQTRCRP